MHVPPAQRFSACTFCRVSARQRAPSAGSALGVRGSAGRAGRWGRGRGGCGRARRTGRARGRSRPGRRSRRRAARSAAALATPGPHIIPWPPAAATTAPVDRAVRTDGRAEDRQVVGGVVDGGGPGLAQPDLPGRRQQRRHPRPHHLEVRRVELAWPRPGCLVGVAHPPQHPALAAAASRCPTIRSKTIGSRSGAKSGCGSVTTTWWRAPPRGDPHAGAPPDRRQRRPAGQHHPRGGDVAGRRADADDAAALDVRSPVNAVRSQHPHAGAEQRGGVGQHVARRVDVPVARRRTTQPSVCPGAIAGFIASTSSESTQRTSSPTRLLHRDPLAAAARDLRLGEARHEVALRHEAGVDPEQLAAGRRRSPG